MLCTAVVLSRNPRGPAAPLTGSLRNCRRDGLLAAAVTVPASPEIPSPGRSLPPSPVKARRRQEVTRIEGILADAAAAQEVTLCADPRSQQRVQRRPGGAATRGRTRRRWRPPGQLPRTRNSQRAASSGPAGRGPVPQRRPESGAEQPRQRVRAMSSARPQRCRPSPLAAAGPSRPQKTPPRPRSHSPLLPPTPAARQTTPRKRPRRSRPQADQANAAQVKAVADAKAQRTVLVGQLASLRNTTAALESAGWTPWTASASRLASPP